MGTKTYWAKIHVGLRPGYKSPPLSIDIVHTVCQGFVNKIGWCVTVTPTEYIYKDGSEPGAVVGIINYPRFPLPKRKIRKQTLELAGLLLTICRQNRVSVVFPNKTVMLTNPHPKEA